MDTLLIYRSVAGGWRWRLRAGNGHIIGASTEGYSERNKCIANASRNTAVLFTAADNGTVFNRHPHPPMRVLILGKR